MLPAQINKAIVCLHITAVLNVLVGLGFLVLGIALLIFSSDIITNSEAMFSGLIGLIYFMCISGILIGMAVFIEIVIYQLKQHRYWAWIAAIIICGVNLSSIYFVLGLIGLIGLANKEVAKHYIHQ